MHIQLHFESYPIRKERMLYSVLQLEIIEMGRVSVEEKALLKFEKGIFWQCSFSCCYCLFQQLELEAFFHICSYSFCTFGIDALFIACRQSRYIYHNIIIIYKSQKIFANPLDFELLIQCIFLLHTMR